MGLLITFYKSLAINQFALGLVEERLADLKPMSTDLFIDRLTYSPDKRQVKT